MVFLTAIPCFSGKTILYFSLVVAWFPINCYSHWAATQKCSFYLINHISAFGTTINLTQFFFSTCRLMQQLFITIKNGWMAIKTQRIQGNIIWLGTKWKGLELKIDSGNILRYETSNLLFIPICWHGNSVPNFNQHWILIAVWTNFFSGGHQTSRKKCTKRLHEPKPTKPSG